MMHAIMIMLYFLEFCVGAATDSTLLMAAGLGMLLVDICWSLREIREALKK